MYRIQPVRPSPKLSNFTGSVQLQVHRALPASLGAQLRAALDGRYECSGAGTPGADEVVRQWPAARAVILLMGSSGLRRTEAAPARREDLRPAEGRDDRGPSASISSRTARQTHTFGTRAVAHGMPTDVVRAILAHASLQTTSIYVGAERRRMLDAATRHFAAEDE